MNIKNMLKKLVICFCFVLVNIAHCNLSDYFFESSIYTLKRVENNLKNKDVFYELAKGHDYLLVNVYDDNSENNFQDIKLYNKAWFFKRSFDYKNARRLLLDALKQTDNQHFKSIIVGELTVVESILEFDLKKLRENKRWVSYTDGEYNASHILKWYFDAFLQSLIERSNSPFSKECFHLFKKIHEDSSNLRQVYQKILLIKDKRKRELCLHLFFYFYETGLHYVNDDALKLADEINECISYYVIANSADFFDGSFVKSYDNWVVAKILYYKAFKSSGNGFFKSCLYVDLPVLSKANERKFERLLSEMWEIKRKANNE